MKKRILSFTLTLLIITGAFSITGAFVTAKEDISFDYVEINKGGDSGFVDRKAAGTLTVVEEDGRKALKYVPDVTGENSGIALAIEGYGIGKFGAAYDTYRYA